MPRPGADDERREPLWASSLATQPSNDDVTVVVEREQAPPRPRPRPLRRERPGTPDAAPAPSRSRSRSRQWAARRIAVVLGVLAVAGTFWSMVDGSGQVSLQQLSSSWDDTPMTCTTLRVETGRDRVVEAFNCRGDDGLNPPAGDYTSPHTVWQSDVDRRAATRTGIRIRDGLVKGWAIY
jgi:hypothetical protein